MTIKELQNYLNEIVKDQNFTGDEEVIINSENWGCAVPIKNLDFNYYNGHGYVEILCDMNGT